MAVTTRLREGFDGEAIVQRYAAAGSISYPNAIICSTCGGTVFADEQSYDGYLRSLEYDPSNQFICDDCTDAAIDEHR